MFGKSPKKQDWYMHIHWRRKLMEPSSALDSVFPPRQTVSASWCTLRRGLYRHESQFPPPLAFLEFEVRHESGH